MREHIRKLHNGRRDVIKSGKFTRYLSQDEQQTQGKVPKDLVVTCVKRRSFVNRIEKNTRNLAMDQMHCFIPTFVLK